MTGMTPTEQMAARLTALQIAVQTGKVHGVTELAEQYLAWATQATTPKGVHVPADVLTEMEVNYDPAGAQPFGYLKAMREECARLASASEVDSDDLSVLAALALLALGVNPEAVTRG